MKRDVKVVLLCEDKQHEAFGRRFLERMGWPKRNLRVVSAQRGIGSAEQFVREQFPVELKAYRSRKNQVSMALLVMLDGDDRGVDRRIAELDVACTRRGVPYRRPNEHVLVFVPTWRIETWLAYLGGETADEGKPDYPRLARQRECRPHVDKLADMCHRGALREPAPSSLHAACTEYRRWSDSMPRS